MSCLPGRMIGLDLQQGYHAFGEVIEFLDAGAEHLVYAVVKLAAIVVFSGFEYHEVAAVFFPVGDRTQGELTGKGIQAQLAVGELGIHWTVVTFRQRGMNDPQFAFGKIGNLAHAACRTRQARRIACVSKGARVYLKT